MTAHQQRILLVEDNNVFSADMIDWLKRDGYDVIHVKDESSAHQALDHQHIHVLLTDLNLNEAEKQVKHGIGLLEKIIAHPRFAEVPRNVVTSYPDPDVYADLFQKYKIYRVVTRKGSYKADLLYKVRETFADKVLINFALGYDMGCDALIPQIAADVLPDVIKHEGAPPGLDAARLEPEIRDVLGRLFYDADHIHIEKLNPGLAGAAVLRVDPHWRAANGWGAQCVVKIGRRDKIEVEDRNYRSYVMNMLANNVPANIGVAYSYDLGAVLYRLAENASGALGEFDRFYERRDSNAIAACIESVFRNTCRAWYDAKGEQTFVDLPRRYFDALNLSLDRLAHAAADLLPDFDPAANTLTFPGGGVILNPIHWLAQHQTALTVRVFECTTHGDLTGRNMMVDPQASLEAIACWLIDFYRTGRSPLLRDFAILETDITYRLLATASLSEFRKLQRDLHETGFQPFSPPPKAHETRLEKAANALKALRGLGMDMNKGAAINDNDRKSYWIALLMTHLNVIRLPDPPIKPEQKCQALVAASLICNQLDALYNRQTTEPQLDDVEQLCSPQA